APGRSPSGHTPPSGRTPRRTDPGRHPPRPRPPTGRGPGTWTGPCQGRRTPPATDRNRPRFSRARGGPRPARCGAGRGSSAGGRLGPGVELGEGLGVLGVDVDLAYQAVLDLDDLDRGQGVFLAGGVGDEGSAEYAD